MVMGVDLGIVVGCPFDEFMKVPQALHIPPLSGIRGSESLVYPDFKQTERRPKVHENCIGSQDVDIFSRFQTSLPQ